jgi:hypothetical protein
MILIINPQKNTYKLFKNLPAVVKNIQVDPPHKPLSYAYLRFELKRDKPMKHKGLILIRLYPEGEIVRNPFKKLPAEPI